MLLEKTNITQKYLQDVILKYIQRNLSLMATCRKSIRKYILKVDKHTNLFHRIPELPLPTNILGSGNHSSETNQIVFPSQIFSLSLSSLKNNKYHKTTSFFLYNNHIANNYYMCHVCVNINYSFFTSLLLSIHSIFSHRATSHVTAM